MASVLKSYKYFVSESEELFVNIPILVEIFGLSFKTIVNGVIKYNNDESDCYLNLRTSENCYIKFTSLPKNSVTKHELPKTEGEAIDIIKLRTEASRQQSLDSELALISTEISDKLDTEWPRSATEYREIFKQNFADIIKYARTERLLLIIDEYASRGVDLKRLHAVYEEISIHQELVFQTISPEYLGKKIQKGKEQGFSKVLIHGNKGKESKRKISIAVRSFIIGLYCHPEAYTLVNIMKQVKKHLLLTVSYSTIKRVIADPKVKNLGKIGVKGVKWFLNDYIPYLIGKDPEYPGDLYSADGTRYQFICMGSDGKIKFLRAYTVIDVHSHRAFGSIGESENRYLALSAFKYAVKQTGFLPREVLVDKANYYTKSEEFKNFINQTSCMGVLWKQVDQPRQNPVERYHLTFQTRVCNGKKYYVGDGIKSKRHRGKPSPDVIALYRDEKNLITETELRYEYFKNLEEFNNERF